MKKFTLLLNICIVLVLFSCKKQVKVQENDAVAKPESIVVKKRNQPKNLTYHIESAKEFLAKNSSDSIQTSIA